MNMPMLKAEAATAMPVLAPDAAVVRLKPRNANFIKKKEIKK
jgi:hypothetical protein